MLSFRILLIPVLAIFLNRSEFPLSYQIKVLKVYDGDTLQIKFGPFKERLRLSLIDAPELSQPNGVGEYSKTCLQKILAQKKELILEVGKRDIYGRLLGDIKGVTEELISRGCTGFYPYAQFASAAEKMFYLRLQVKAREKRLGLWSGEGYRRPSLWRQFKKQTLRRP